MTTCPKCGGAALTMTPTPSGPHHGKLTCADCGRFVGWAPKPRCPIMVGEKALHLGETVTVLWLKSGWAGLEGADGRQFSTSLERLKGLAS